MQIALLLELPFASSAQSRYLPAQTSMIPNPVPLSCQRTIHAISACNRAILRAEKEAPLLQEICRLLVQAGGYRSAWIGYGVERLQVVSQWSTSGLCTFLDGVSWPEQALAERSLETRSPQLSTWGDRPGAGPVPIAVVLPLLMPEPLGVLLLYAHRPLDTEEMSWLTQLSEDLVYRIVTLRHHQQAVSGLQNGGDRHLDQVRLTEQRLQQEISDRQHAESVLRQQTERERLMITLAQRIQQSLNLTETLEQTAADLRQFLAVDRVIVQRINSDQSCKVVVESMAEGYPSMQGWAIRDVDSTHRRSMRHYSRGQLRSVDNVAASNLGEKAVQLLKRFSIQALLVVPIFRIEASVSARSRSLWGFLAIHQCSGPRLWQGFEQDLLQQLATHLAIAIHQSELCQQVRQLNSDLEYQVQERTAQLHRVLHFEEMLKRITDKVRDSLDEDQILHTAVEELATGLEVESCDASLYDLTRQTATVCYECTIKPPSMRRGVLLMADKPSVYECLLQGEAVQFCTLGSPDEERCAVLACPMVDDQGVIGDLWLIKAKDDAFSAAEVRLVGQVANQCAIAMRQARLYQAAQAQVAELERLNRLKNDFLSTVSHELRTPMTNLKMAIQMLEISFKRSHQAGPDAPISPETSRTERYLRILQNEADREIRLINDLLDLQRLDAGVQSLIPEAIDLALWLPPLLEPFRARFQQQQQDFQLNLPSHALGFISDVRSLERILTELLNNACKYTPAEEHISLTVEPTAQGILFTITNSGVEIPEEELPHLFERFYRVPSADPWKQGGTGLGLALVERLVEHIEGKIWLESRHQHVSVMVELPLRLKTAIEVLGRRGSPS